MATLFVQEAVNLFVGDDGPDNSKHLNLESIKHPDLEETTVSHLGGGAIGEIEIGGLGLKALAPTFKIKGYDPQVMRQFGLGSRQIMPFTSYGVVRDKLTGRAIEVKAIYFGRITKLSGDEQKRGDLTSHDHDIKEVLHYELFFDKQEMFFYDLRSSTWRVNGQAENTDFNAILRIPGA